MNRVFIAAEVPPETTQWLIDKGKKFFPEYAKGWEAVEKLHITLKFIGNIESEQLDMLKSALTEIRNLFCFDLIFNKFVFFYRGNTPVIFWAGTKPSEELNRMFKLVENLCLKNGIPANNFPFKPHLTLMRIKDPRLAKEIGSLPEPPSFSLKTRISETTLFESVLNPAGSEYRRLSGFKLKNNLAGQND